MSQQRRLLLVSLGLIAVVIGISALFFFLVFRSPDGLRGFLVRLVFVSLLLFLAILFLRYFSLLWFAYLQHTEDSVAPEIDPTELPPVSIIVPAHNEGLVLDAAIKSLMRLDYPNYEIVVVDDGSSDETLDTAARWQGRREGIELKAITKNQGGKASALNYGIAHSTHELVLCMDADSWLDPGTLRQAVRHFRDTAVGAVAGNVKVANRTNWLTRLQALEYIEGLNMPRRAQGFLAAVNIVPGPIGMFRREALDEVGGYDTDTFAEDADLTLKLITAGWKVMYEPRAVAWTQAPTQVLDLIQQRYRWTRGILQAIRKRKRMFLVPLPDFPLWLSGVEMLFEAVLWPALNVYAHLFFAAVALLFGMGEFLLHWWLLLTLLDLVIALTTVVMEEEDLKLVPYAVVYRFFFILFLDVTKAFSAVEELWRVGMDWGKLRREALAGAGATQ